MTVSLTMIPGKAMMQLILETIPRHVTDKEVTRKSAGIHTREITLDQLNNLLQ